LKEDNGCPPKETKAVREGETIKILDRVYFETGKAEIKPESFNLLDQVALILRSNPDIKKVEIAGHTDDVGADEKNMVLSQERADSVRLYLMEREIAGDRLVAKGYGETKPLTPNRNNAARSMNRRVEFNILEQ
jgi:outer membrane protein OmpA-like peptidoglycan-associated protein